MGAVRCSLTAGPGGTPGSRSGGYTLTLGQLIADRPLAPKSYIKSYDYDYTIRKDYKLTLRLTLS